MNTVLIVACFLSLDPIGGDEFRESRILLTDPSFLLSQIKALESKVQHLEAAFQDVQMKTGGATYIRWGKTSCPANISEMVYSGYMGGSFRESVGGAADPVCLTASPILVSVGGEGQFMRGAEYGSDAFGPSIIHNDIPCAVCRSLTDRSVVMIPGTNICASGWNHQFHGLLASGHATHHSATQFVCIDKNPDSLIGGQSAMYDGRELYAVRASCGSLKCPPYQNNKELTCVVCTK